MCNLLLIDKSAFLARDALSTFCPSLNARQVKSFLSAFVPDEIAPDKCPLEVLDKLTAEVRKDQSLKLEERFIQI